MTESDYPARPVRVGLAQFAVSQNPERNHQTALDALRELGQKGAQIACLPEVHNAPYFPLQARDGAHEKDLEPWYVEDTSCYMGELAAVAAHYKMVILVPVVQRSELRSAAGYPLMWNRVVLLGTEGQILGKYSKTHIPQDPSYYEKDYFAAAPQNYQSFATPYGNIAALICYDQWFPEAARASVLAGADILFYPTAIGWLDGYEHKDENWENAWQTLQRAHGIANGCHIVAVNRIGREGPLEFFGHSFVSDAFGNVRYDAVQRCENTVVELDLSMNSRIREGWGFLINRRPDTYGKLL